MRAGIGGEGWSWLGVGGWILWACWFAAWETLGMWKRADQFPTLTNLTKRFIPGWALAMGAGWLTYHFVVQAYTIASTR